MTDSIRTIPVRVQPPYDVSIGSGLLGRCGDYLAALLGQRKIAVLTDDTVAPLYLDTVTAALEGAGFTVCSHVFPAGEGHKDLSTLAELLEFLASEHLTRTDCVAALGGGVVGDMAGFAAAVYLRGIRYVQLPTLPARRRDLRHGLPEDAPPRRVRRRGRRGRQDRRPLR